MKFVQKSQKQIPLHLMSHAKMSKKIINVLMGISVSSMLKCSKAFKNKFVAEAIDVLWLR